MTDDVLINEDLWKAYSDFRYEISLLSRRQLEILKRLHVENDAVRILAILEKIKSFAPTT